MNAEMAISTVLEDRPVIQRIYLVGCGGSLADLYPAKCLIDSVSKSLTVGYYTSNEFVHAVPAALGETSLVITASHAGNTPETVEAARVAREHGARTIVVTWTEGSPLTKHGDCTVLYEFGKEARIDRTKMAVVLRMAFELVKHYDRYPHYGAALKAFEMVHDIVHNARAKMAERAVEFATRYSQEPMFYVMGSGPSFSAAYAYSICILMEMQWINAAALHTGEYFHGPLEVTDDKVPFILLMNEGRLRELDERALRFLRSYGGKIILLDARELGMGALNPAVVEYFDPLVFNSVLRMYAERLAEVRQHPLTVRRYMWKVEY